MSSNGAGPGGVRRLRTTTAAVLLCSLVAALFAASTAFALSPERHYEMVSPVFKAGYGVSSLQAVAIDGEHVAFDSLGSFAGAPTDQIGEGFGGSYLASRTVSGWSIAPLMLPASIGPFNKPPLPDLSPMLDESLFSGRPGPNEGVANFESGEMDLFLHNTSLPDDASGFEIAGEPIRQPTNSGYVLAGATPDFSHIIVGAEGSAPLTEEAEGINPQAKGIDYDLQSHGTPALRYIGVNNQAMPRPIAGSCLSMQIGAETAGLPELSGKDSTYNALADDGREIFFWTCPGVQGRDQLYVRLNGERTLEVSRPLGEGPDGGCVGEGNGIAGEVPCDGAASRPSAEFVGASSDGAKVFFLTQAKLVVGDEDTTTQLYMAKIGCPESESECPVSRREVTELRRVSTPVTGSTANVQGLIAMDPGASHLYFVARGVLSKVNSQGQAPVDGADNLYVYDSNTQTTTFIASLCSGEARSGERPDAHCPANWHVRGNSRVEDSDEQLWQGTEPNAQVTGDGQFFIFTSYAQLTSDDTDNATDIYRYAVNTDHLTRVSVAEAGYEANGNQLDEAGKENADAHIGPNTTGHPLAWEQELLRTRAISEDGSRIVLRSAAPLSPDAKNGLTNAYEWHDGIVSLVSSGSDEQPTGEGLELAISPSGHDIFFMTVQKLLPQDTDETFDLYDARLGPPEFPVPAPVKKPCSPEACQGPLTNPAPLLVPGSFVQPSGEEYAVSIKTVKRARHPRVKRMRARRISKRKRSRGMKRPARRKSVRGR